MAIPSFYHPRLSGSESSIVLSQEEGLHAVKARRLKVGRDVRVFNGQGLVGEAVIAEIERRKVSVDVTLLQQHDKPNCRPVIATAIPKGDRQKVMLDMLTQLGVSEIIPIRCERSITHFNDSMASKWQRIMIEACKQSQNPWLPALGDEIKLLDLINDDGKQFVYTDLSGQNAETVFTSGQAQIILIGPEGGFSDAELNALIKLNVSTLSLGGHILRTEAAAVAAVSQFNALSAISKSIG